MKTKELIDLLSQKDPEAMVEFCSANTSFATYFLKIEDEEDKIIIHVGWK